VKGRSEGITVGKPWLDAGGTEMSAGQMVLENMDRAPWWPKLRMEFTLLLAELRDDPRYSERAKHISALLADPRFPKIEQIYFVPQKAFTLS
jgi:hypothetical protein